MGVNVSKENVETILESVFDASLYSQCPIVSVDQEQEVGDITATDCDVKVTLTQDATLDDTCALTSTIDSLTDYFMKNKQKISDGLLPRLVNVDDITTREEVRSQISALVESVCSEDSTSQKQHVGNILCAASKMDIGLLQKFRGKTACLADTVVKRAEEWKATQEQDTERSLGVAEIFEQYKWLIISVSAMLVLLVIVVAVWSNTEGGKGVMSTATAFTPAGSVAAAL